MALDLTFRPATLADAGPIAVLMDIAGNGIPNAIWLDQAGPGQSALEVARRSVRREKGVDSYRNATIAMSGAEIAACMIGGLPEQLYDLSCTDENFSDEKLGLFQPVARLAAQATGTWFIDVIASFAEFRGLGIGGKLLELAASKAREACAPANSLVVGSWNEGAVNLYVRAGFAPAAQEKAILPEGFPFQGDWVMMIRPLP